MESRKISLCICGGGGLGTVIAGIAASNGYDVNILTSRPSEWEYSVTVLDKNGRKYNGTLNKISANPAEVISESDIVLFCLPGSVINDELIKIKSFLRKGAVVGSVFSCTGFFIMAIAQLGENVRLFGFQRVPFIARVKEYGHTALLLDYRKSLNVAFWGVTNPDELRQQLEGILITPINVLEHVLQVTLTNSNPILHPSRLYSMLKNYHQSQSFETVPYFYRDWTNESSQTLIDCDAEFQKMLSHLGLQSSVTPPLLEYYESWDASSLTRKIASIESLKELRVPMIKSDSGGYIPDWNNRYFIEDISYGMMLIKFICQERGIETPHIDQIITWFQEKIGKSYMIDNRLLYNQDTKEIACLNFEVIQKLFKTLRRQ